MTRQQKRLRVAMPWLVTIGIILVWDASCVVLNIPPFILPRPSVVFDAMIRYRGTLAYHGLYTLMTTMAGFALAVVAGLLLGLATGASSLVYSGLYPVLVAFNSIPKVAIVPVVILWVGIGAIPAIITAFAISFFPIVVNVATGLATIEPEMQDVLRSLGASRYEILTKAGIPRSMPYLFGSLKIAVTLAFVGSVISETVASNEGIGYLMLSASSRFDVPLVFAGLFVISVMGVVMYAICVWIERRMTKWAFRGSLIS